MKTMKLALLATAALAAVTVSARADSSADIKAQLEALNARIAQLEAMPAAPTGASLLSMSEVEAITFAGDRSGDANMAPAANRISILPTADVPAAGSIDWSMEVRANLTYTGAYDAETSDGAILADVESDIDLRARARLAAHGSTDTSVGKVGVKIRLQGASDFTSDGAVTAMNVAYGYWNMTEELQLIGGFTGSLSGIGYGQDAATFGNTAAPGSISGDQEQMQLAYASGPISFGIAIEDGNDNDSTGDYEDIGVAGEIKYSGDTISGEISVGYVAGDAADDLWVAGIGLGFALGDIANLSFAAQAVSDDRFNVSLLGTVDVTESAYLEASIGYKSNYEYLGLVQGDTTIINVGAYWAPVDQLTIGVQADHQMWDGIETIATGIDTDVSSRTSVSLITWFRF